MDLDFFLSLDLERDRDLFFSRDRERFLSLDLDRDFRLSLERDLDVELDGERDCFLFRSDGLGAGLGEVDSDFSLIFFSVLEELDTTIVCSSSPDHPKLLSVLLIGRGDGHGDGGCPHLDTAGLSQRKLDTGIWGSSTYSDKGLTSRFTLTSVVTFWSVEGLGVAEDSELELLLEEEDDEEDDDEGEGGDGGLGIDLGSRASSIAFASSSRLDSFLSFWQFLP